VHSDAASHRKPSSPPSSCESDNPQSRKEAHPITPSHQGQRPRLSHLVVEVRRSLYTVRKKSVYSAMNAFERKRLVATWPREIRGWVPAKASTPSSIIGAVKRVDPKSPSAQ
jgi:hypothetical protein